jgi:mono/diheme cytochrome c family protein
MYGLFPYPPNKWRLVCCDWAHRVTVMDSGCQKTAPTKLDKEAYAMSLSVDSKIKEIKKNPAAVELMEGFTPGFGTDPQMKLVGGLTFRALAKFPQANISDEQLEDIDQALKALGE